MGGTTAGRPAAHASDKVKLNVSGEYSKVQRVSGCLRLSRSMVRAPDTARSMIADLSTEQREALLLTQLLGLSYADAAAVCGCPVGTIRSRVARARDALLADAERDNLTG